MSDRIANKVYRTSNYDKFKPFKGNRGQTSGHVRMLAQSLKDHGWIDSLPMSVKREDDGRFSIIDGHNRFHAAKAIGTEVKYTIINGEVSGADDVYLINRTQRRWSTLDYIKSYAQMGYPEYEIVAAFIEKHKCGAMPACCLLANQPTMNTSTIQGGSFRVSDETKANVMIEWLKQINAAAKISVFRSNFTRVFIKACNVKGFSGARFVAQVVKRPASLVQYARVQDIAMVMEEIYNYGYASRNRIPLAFLIQQQ